MSVLKTFFLKQLKDIKMKLIKIICFLFLLSSCDKYLGNVEADYIPKNESSKIFLDEVYVNSLTELALLNPILYPKKLSRAQNN